MIENGYTCTTIEQCIKENEHVTIEHHVTQSGVIRYIN